MATSSTGEITQLILDWSEAKSEESRKDAFEKLFPLVYDELRRLARHYRGEQYRGHTLQATALVNEAYVRLIGSKARQVRPQNRLDFFGLAAKVMRDILVDHARAQLRQKRGGGLRPVSLDEALLVVQEPDVNLLALDAALTALDAVKPRQSRVVELRFFGGLSATETAAVLKVSPDTVERDWIKAKAWLLRELSRKNDDAQRT